MTLLLLFWEYFKTGLFAVGGGLATVPFLTEMSAKYGWFTLEELSNMIAVSESTPGPIGINMAAYVGMTTAGLPGGILAPLALTMPSYLVILLIAGILTKFRRNRHVNNAFSALHPVVTALIAGAGLSVALIVLFDTSAMAEGGFTAVFRWPLIALFAALSAVTLKWKKLHPILIVLIGAAAGILLGVCGLL